MLKNSPQFFPRDQAGPPATTEMDNRLYRTSLRIEGETKSGHTGRLWQNGLLQPY
jgi:hypothetical protein